MKRFKLPICIIHGDLLIFGYYSRKKIYKKAHRAVNGGFIHYCPVCIEEIEIFEIGLPLPCIEI